MSDEKLGYDYKDHKDAHGAYVREAYPTGEVDRALVDREEELAHTTEGEHGTKRALVSFAALYAYERLAEWRSLPAYAP